VRRTALLLLALSHVGGAAAQSPPPKAQQCVVCHGALGISTAPDAPNLAGQPRQYLVAQMKQFRTGKRASEVMNVIAKPLSDEEIDALSDWYASIRISAAPTR
jgi:cytochrome c553